MENMQTLFVTDREAAKITGIAVQTLRNYRGKQRGPAYTKIGASVRYSINDLMTYMNAHRITPDDRNVA